MPIVDLSDPNVWKRNYRFEVTGYWYAENGARPRNDTEEIWLGYHRVAMLGVSRQNAKHIILSLGLTSTSKIALIGAGFNWEGEQLELALPGIQVAPIDISPWIHSVKDGTEDEDIEAAMDASGITDPDRRALWLSRLGGRPRAVTPILDEDMSTGASRKAIRDTLGIVDLVVTMDVLSWLTDAEARAMSSRGNQLVIGKVAHLTSVFDPILAQKPEPESAWNWKTLEDWKTLLPSDTLIERGSGRVL